MATIKHARVIAVRDLGPDTRLLEIEPDEPLAFRGGQYVIIDSGLLLPNGKALKRAYSFVSSDDDTRRFQLAVKRLPAGPGSTFVHGLAAGAPIRFSGPWGKLFPSDEAPGRTLILATDTGVSAALGLVQSARLRPLLAHTDFVWWRASHAYFVPDAFVLERIPAGCRRVRLQTGPGIGHPERLAYARSIVDGVLGEGPLSHVFIAGDGSVNYALLEALQGAGLPLTRDHVESFFNMPKKSA